VHLREDHLLIVKEVFLHLLLVPHLHLLSFVVSLKPYFYVAFLASLIREIGNHLVFLVRVLRVLAVRGQLAFARTFGVELLRNA